MVTKIRNYPEDAAPLVRPVTTNSERQYQPSIQLRIKEECDVTRLLLSVS